MAKIRQIKKILKGQAYHRRRWCAFEKSFRLRSGAAVGSFSSIDDFRSNDPDHYLPGFPGIRIGALKPSHI